MIPGVVEDILAAMLHPGPSASALEGTQPELRKQAFGKTTLDCVMLSRSVPKGEIAPLGLFPTYCLSDEGHIEAIYNFGSRSLVATRFGSFLDHVVTMEAAVFYGKAVLARGRVTSLKTYTPTATEFAPTPEMAATSSEVRVAGGVMQGNLISRVQPVYPSSARADRKSGTVVLSGTIGEDGRIVYLTPMMIPDVDLALAAIEAVRQWRYRPYTLNGEPTRVSTTITVNFNLGH